MTVTGSTRVARQAGSSDASRAVAKSVPPTIKKVKGSVPLTRVIAPLVLETHGNTVREERPHLLDEAVIQLLVPLAPEELPGSIAAAEDLRPIPPVGVLGVRHRYAIWIAAIPGVLGRSDLLEGRVAVPSMMRLGCRPRGNVAVPPARALVGAERPL